MEEKLKILAIDQGSNCGWCTANGYGIWFFPTKKDESAGMKMIRFRTKLKELIEMEGINLIVYERIAGQHANSLIHAAKMAAIMETMCEDRGINYRAWSAGEIKKFATGKGNSGKPLMVAAAKEKYGYDGEDDNIADAIHLYHLAISEYGN